MNARNGELNCNIHRSLSNCRKSNFIFCMHFFPFLQYSLTRSGKKYAHGCKLMTRTFDTFAQRDCIIAMDRTLFIQVVALIIEV